MVGHLPPGTVRFACARVAGDPVNASYMYAEHMGRIELLDPPATASAARVGHRPPGPARAPEGATAASVESEDTGSCGEAENPMPTHAIGGGRSLIEEGE